LQRDDGGDFRRQGGVLSGSPRPGLAEVADDERIVGEIAGRRKLHLIMSAAGYRRGRIPSTDRLELIEIADRSVHRYRLPVTFQQQNGQARIDRVSRSNSGKKIAQVRVLPEGL